MKKSWNNPELKNVSVQQTNEEDLCQENSTKCICEHYHARILLGGCGGCNAPGYICKFTGCKPIFTKKCECTPSQS